MIKDFEVNTIGQRQEYLRLLKQRLMGIDYKLYRYCKIPNKSRLLTSDVDEIRNYAIEDIREKTIYLIPPNKLNDPHDIRIFFDENVIIELMIPLIFDEEYLNSEYKEYLFGVIEKKPEYHFILNDVSNMKTTMYSDFLRSLVKSEDRYSLYISFDPSRTECIENMSLIFRDFVSLFFTNSKKDSSEGTEFAILNKALQVISSDQFKGMFEVVSLADQEGFQIDLDNIPKMVTQSTYLLMKMLGTENPIFDISTIFKKLDESILNLSNKFRDKLGDYLGVTCFTIDPKNDVMWAHYASNHEGFCIEYDFHNLSDDQLLPYLSLEEVDYRDDDIIFDSLVLNALNSENDPFDLPITLRDFLHRFLYRKMEKWDYEKEWRLFGRIKDYPKRKMPAPDITKIILGQNMDNQIQSAIRNFISNLSELKDIPVVKNEIDIPYSVKKYRTK